ncbi:hypothetical protein P26218_34 [Rhodoferax phage P26218]|uniref:hypothetical protein n=1 Tax=Rhodoferax phage P26218 TaxID=1636270 RepID=UPI0005FEB64B|nr:hypothetical protein AXJ08_gp34 [Rhodoferax phage P26218]AKA60337.1 hypothetical protein P26218_34 [Rhodoferax phage P26218]
MPGPNPSILNMRSGQNAIAGGGTQFGWISGDIAGLALSATAIAIFDLGPNWDQYNVVQVGVVPAGPSSGLSAVQVFSSDDAAFNATTDVQLNNTWATTFGAISAAITTPQTSGFSPMGRYLIVRATNADGINAQGAGAFIRVTAYPFV